MKWQEKMKQGMRLIKEACAENKGWDSCSKCPFDEYCTALMEKDMIDPYEGVSWEVK